jgi:hypothetical protein
MKFEEVLPLLKAGKRAKRESWKSNEFFCPAKKLFLDDNGYHISLNVDDVLAEDWVILKEKVKYYPVLVRYESFESDDMYFFSVRLYKTVEEAKKFLEPEGLDVIRLVTNIPELIEEREE